MTKKASLWCRAYAAVLTYHRPRTDEGSFRPPPHTATHYFVAVNLCTFVLFGYDKSQAIIVGGWRVPEHRLWFASAARLVRCQVRTIFLSAQDPQATLWYLAQSGASRLDLAVRERPPRLDVGLADTSLVPGRGWCRDEATSLQDSTERGARIAGRHTASQIDRATKRSIQHLQERRPGCPRRYCRRRTTPAVGASVAPISTTCRRGSERKHVVGCTTCSTSSQ